MRRVSPRTRTTVEASCAALNHRFRGITNCDAAGAGRICAVATRRRSGWRGRAFYWHDTVLFFDAVDLPSPSPIRTTSCFSSQQDFVSEFLRHRSRPRLMNQSLLGPAPVIRREDGTARPLFSQMRRRDAGSTGRRMSKFCRILGNSTSFFRGCGFSATAIGPPLWYEAPHGGSS